MKLKNIYNVPVVCYVCKCDDFLTTDDIEVFKCKSCGKYTIHYEKNINKTEEIIDDRD